MWSCGAVQDRRIARKSRGLIGMQFRLFDSCEGWTSDASEELLVGEDLCSGCMLSDSLYMFLESFSIHGECGSMR
jgi:hypothetical protein